MEKCETAGATARVAVVDDDEAVRDSLKLLLETDGMDVVAYASGEAFLADYPGSGCDCVMLDVQLPGLSGIGVLRQLAASGFDYPVILMTARPSESLCLEAERAGALTLLFKPLNDIQLFDAIRDGLASRAAAPA